MLKYHNHHADLDEYIHRAYNPLTGEQTLYEVLHRHQFPLFSEVLDQLELATRPLGALTTRLFPRDPHDRAGLEELNLAPSVTLSANSSACRMRLVRFAYQFRYLVVVHEAVVVPADMQVLGPL